MKRTALGILVLAGMGAWANTGTVTAELSSDESAFEVAFDTHAY